MLLEQPADKHGFNPIVSEIFKKLCSYVNANYDEIDFSSDWYEEHEWTNDNEIDFEKWLTVYFNNNKEARKAFNVSANNISDVVERFVFDFGWKIDVPILIKREHAKIVCSRIKKITE